MLLDTTAAPGTTWVVDHERSTVGFTVAHFGGATVKGRFGTFAGTLADRLELLVTGDLGACPRNRSGLRSVR
jgi:polyisoprenoid-binding protein YceI